MVVVVGGLMLPILGDHAVFLQLILKVYILAHDIIKDLGLILVMVIIAAIGLIVGLISLIALIM